MQSVFSRSAWWSTTFAAAWLLLPGLSAAGLQDRPGRILCPIEESHCPFGLGQWMAQRHRWTHGDGPRLETATDESSPTHESLDAPPPQNEAHDDNGHCGDHEFDCPYYGGKNYRDYEADERYRAAIEENEWSAEEDCNEAHEAGASFAEAIGDSRHGMGQRFVLHLNTLNDGLDDELDAEVEWHEPFLPNEAEMPSDTEVTEESFDEESPDERWGGEEDAQEEPGFFERFGMRISTVVNDVTTLVADTLQHIAAEEAQDRAAPWCIPLPEQRLEPRDFIPAFGSPYEDSDF